MTTTSKRGLGLALSAVVAASMITTLPALSTSAAAADAGLTIKSGHAMGKKANKGGTKRPLRKQFERLATFPVYKNLPDGADAEQETSAEIAGVSKDGMTVVYTDSPGKRLGFVDISNPAKPKALGGVDLTKNGDAEDEPTSVYVHGDHILAVINTSESYVKPSGRLDVISMKTREVVHSVDLEGQPDSIAVSGDGKYAAIAIENERDEEATPKDGEEGDLPQMPAGFVQVIDVEDADATNWTATRVDLVDEDGKALPMLAEAGIDTPEDPEPEYVSINADNIAAVSLQENNGIVLIDLATKKLTKAFSAGNAQVSRIDTEKDGVYNPTGSIDKPREPDAIAWVDRNYLATANEGDWKGGTRGWTVFDTRTGKVSWDAGNSFEHIAAKYGLHNEGRAGKKGSEPEGIAIAKYQTNRIAFVASERSNFVAVYDIQKQTRPKLRQVLPTTVGPEGLLPIPNRNLLVVASEVDEAEEGIRSTIQVYGLESNDQDEFPSIVANGPIYRSNIGWGALSGLAADRWRKDRLVAVSDSAYKEAKIFHIHAKRTRTANIYRETTIRDAKGEVVKGLDLEGISSRADGGYWLASEAKKPEDNRLVRVDPKGIVRQEVSLPEYITSKMGKWGLEGVTSVGRGKHEVLYFVIQRPLWDNPKKKADPVDGDNIARIGRYEVGTGEFSWFGYEMDESAKDSGWVGLSEITALNAAGTKLAVIERDKGVGDKAKHKKVYEVTIPDTGAATGKKVTVLKKKLLVDALPKLKSTNGWTQEKLEGFAVDKIGNMYAVTDNDGVKDANGETVFMYLGQTKHRPFRGGKHSPLKPWKPNKPKNPLKPAKPDVMDLQVLSFSDYHGRLEADMKPLKKKEDPSQTEVGGAEYLATKLKSLRKGQKYSVTVAAGDMIGGSPFLSGLFHDEPTVESMNAMGVDVVGVGNHEFDEGTDELVRIAKGGCHPEDGCYFPETPYKGANFDLLAANVLKKSDAQTLLPAVSVKEYGGVKVGFIGMTLKETPTLVNPAGVSKVTFQDEVRTANKYAKSLQRQGVHSVVVLLHQGGSTKGTLNECNNLTGPIDKIARSMSPVVDLIVTGHTDQAYKCVVPDPSGAPRMVTSSSSYGRVVSETTLKIDRKSGDVIRPRTETTNHLVTRDKADATQTKIIEKWKKLAAPKAARVVGTIKEDVTGDADGDRGIETPMANLIADSILFGTKAKRDGSADVAFMNVGGVRASFLKDKITNGEKPGEITYTEAYETSPFGNMLVTMDLTGAQIKEVLEQQYTPGRSREMLALGVSSGFSYTWDASQAQGNRVVASSMKLNGKRVDMKQTYRVATLNFLASGGDQFTAFTKGKNVLGGPNDLENLVRFLGAKPGVVPPPSRVKGL